LNLQIYKPDTSNQENHVLQSQEPKADNQILIKKPGNTERNNIFKPETSVTTSVIQELQNMMKEYMEKMGAMFNSLATLVNMIM